MIRTKTRFPVNEIKEYDDLRKVKADVQKRYGIYCHIHRIPPLPSFTDKIYRYKDEEMNLYHLTCTCDAYHDKLLLKYEPRDIRSICIHLYYKLITSAAKKYLDQLTLILMEAAVKHNARYLYRYYFSKEKKEVYLSFAEHTEWINIFMQVRSEEDADFVRFGYNHAQHRWNYGKAPELAGKIEYIAEAIKNQLPYQYIMQ
jgi:hypothetical protein